MANRTVSVILQAEIGNYVSNMAKAAVTTKAVGDSAADSSSRVGKGFDLAGKGALLLGGAVAGAFIGAITKSMDFEKSMSAVGAATQATGADLRDLRATAMQAGADTQYSATEAADAITEMGKAGVSTKDIMGGGLKGALSLAAAGQLEVADAAGIASVAMTQFGLTGAQLPHVADLLAAGAGKAMGSVQDLGMALNQSGLVASAAGLSIEETTGTLAAFASAGLTGSDAGTSFKTMLQKLQAPSSEAARTMADLGINVYDTNGNMLSMSSIAGQLQARMGGLTQEQRNAALATIFGSDAVRAANVLYSEGAAGIADWTAKVNDQGYAAKQAAALTDNLAGDIERLGGSFDTLLISIGSGAQGPLRALVQSFTGILDVASQLIDFWTSLPGPVQTAVVALGAVAALKGPVTSALETIALKAMYMGESIAGSSVGMGTLKAAGGGLMSFFGGPWGLAITGAAVGVSLLSSVLGESAGATDEAKSAAQGYTAALEQANGAIDANVRAAAAKAAQDAGLLDVARQAGIGLGTVTDAITNQGGALDAVRAKLEAYLATQTLTFNGENGPEKHLTAQGEATQKAIAGLDLLASKGPAVASAQANIAAATAGAAGAMGEAAAATRDFEAEATAADKAVSALQAALDELSGKTVSLFEAESQLGAAVASATGALDGMTGATLNADGSLNAYSESGRAAGGVLLDIRDKGNQLIATMRQQGATSAQVQAADASLRASFIASARQMGISDAAADALANSILGIPAARNTRITADTGQAMNAILSVQTSLNQLRDKTVTVRTVTTFASGAVSVHPGVTMARAEGGPVWPGQTFLVGERGPELVMFGSAGQVVPAAETRRILSGSRDVAPSQSSIAAPSTTLASNVAGWGNFNVETMIVPDKQHPAETAEQLSFMARTRG